MMNPLENQLRHIISRSAWLSAVLETVRDVGPPGAYVAAGAIRDSVWNFLTGRFANEPAGDVDVVYFDANERQSASRTFESTLRRHVPSLRWEVTNQAHVHRWYRDSQGESLAPLLDVADAMSRWPETATAVGALVGEGGEVKLIAPLGLEDLFSMTLRHNPKHGDAPAYRARLASKSWTTRWPELKVVPSGAV